MNVKELISRLLDQPMDAQVILEGWNGSGDHLVCKVRDLEVFEMLNQVTLTGDSLKDEEEEFNAKEQQG